MEQKNNFPLAITLIQRAFDQSAFKKQILFSKYGKKEQWGDVSDKMLAKT